MKTRFVTSGLFPKSEIAAYFEMMKTHLISLLPLFHSTSPSLINLILHLVNLSFLTCLFKRNTKISLHLLLLLFFHSTPPFLKIILYSANLSFFYLFVEISLHLFTASLSSLIVFLQLYPSSSFSHSFFLFHYSLPLSSNLLPFFILCF